MGAYFNKGGKKVPTAGYYFHCEPGGNRSGGGLWMPMPPELIRSGRRSIIISKNGKRSSTARILKNYFPSGVDGLEILTRPPKGYDDQNPAIEYLKMKNFIVMRNLTDADVQSKSLVKEVLKTFETMKPFIDFMNRAID